ncbi:hypothetical protein [Halorientalis halophila]|uniref:hypothetical protein n=1 Tax=Halorientalis halophila TaxID=3108499 RepID=UPI003008C906
MTYPAQAVTGLFSLVVAILVLILTIGTLWDWNVNYIAQVASQFAVPFVLALVSLYLFLEIREMAD